jgi:hypothetical protein
LAVFQNHSLRRQSEPPSVGKLSEMSADRGISYFKAKFPAVEAWQIALNATSHRQTATGIELAPATVFLSRLQ